MNIRKRLATALVAIGLTIGALAVPAVASAATFYEQTNCDAAAYAADTARYTLYEHETIPSNGAADDRAPMCYANTNLENADNVVECDGAWWYQHPNWNDCADSISAVIPAGRVLCLYVNQDYQGFSTVPNRNAFAAFAGGTSGRILTRTSLGGVLDQLTSVRFVVGHDRDDCG